MKMKNEWISAKTPPPDGERVLLCIGKEIVPAAYNRNFFMRNWWGTIDTIHYSKARCWMAYPSLPKKGEFEESVTDENYSI